MIDYIGLITNGGIVLFQKHFEEESKIASTKKEIQQFICETFLNEKIQIEHKSKVNQHVFYYEQNPKKHLIYVVGVLEVFQSPSYHNYLANVQLYFDRLIGDTTHDFDFINLFTKQYSFESDLTEILVQTFAEEDDKKRRQMVQTKEKPEVKSQISEIKPKFVKKSTEWDPLMTSNNSKNRKEEDKKLNFSKVSDPTVEKDLFKTKYMDNDSHTDSFIDVSSDEETEVKLLKPSLFSRFKSSISKISEGKNMDLKTLNPILDIFKDDLIRKNVAVEIADKICENLCQKLLNSKADLLTSTKNLVKSALNDSLVSILTPKNNIDLIAMALKKKELGRPFVVTFIGVNGVGKSTNLAKVAYLFKTQGFSVILAACDNFRSGAVEQLKKHAECLEIPIFERGYRDESSNIARDCIIEASQKKIDVVLIDTAGRMQDNEPLMKELAKLVNSNNPDAVLFIGEALTGNDGVDQLTKFNSALRDLSAKIDYNTNQSGDNSKKGIGREIDGIILSKFDTVDDKVGAALSLTYATGKPIVYLGVGQKYQNLQKPNINSIIKSLLR